MLFSTKEPENVREVLPQYHLRPAMDRCTTVANKLAHVRETVEAGRYEE